MQVARWRASVVQPSSAIVVPSQLVGARFDSGTHAGRSKQQRCVRGPVRAGADEDDGCGTVVVGRRVGIAEGREEDGGVVVVLTTMRARYVKVRLERLFGGALIVRASTLKLRLRAETGPLLSNRNIASPVVVHRAAASCPPVLAAAHTDTDDISSINVSFMRAVDNGWPRCSK